MINIGLLPVCFETAKILRNAGFQPPEPEKDQIWFAPEGQPMRITEVYGPIFFAIGVPEKLNITRKNAIFAPTAFDILDNLNGKDEPVWRCANDAEGYKCYHIPSGISDNKTCFDIYEPEACAKAWLKAKGWNEGPQE